MDLREKNLSINSERVIFPDPEIITSDPEMSKILNLAERVACYSTNVLITGESGSGKDLIARYIHQKGPRSIGPFIKVDCTSIPADLIESELFGHEKGAFTGAYHFKQGRLELADHGVLFLDQVGELPIGSQSKLTRVIQEKTFERLGSNLSISIDMQIVASSRNDLSAYIRDGKFREELFYRLNIFPICLPPLRDRGNDISVLTHFFLEKFRQKYALKNIQMDPSAIAVLNQYHWPGNIRELENLIERTILLNTGTEVIKSENLPELDWQFDTKSLDDYAQKLLSLGELEKVYIQRILQKSHGNKSRAAKILGINRKTLLEKRKKYNLP